MSGKQSAGTDEQLVSGYAARLLIAVSVGWLAIQAGRLVLSPMLLTVRTDLGMTNTESGLVFTVIWGLYAVLQYPSGRLSDALSRRLLLVAGLVLVAAGFAILGTAPTYPVFMLGAVVVGLGAGLYPTAARALISDLYVQRRGQAFGLHTASGDLGGVAAAGLSALVLAVAVWRAAYLAPVLTVLLVALALHVWGREAYGVGRADLAVRETASRLLGNSDLRQLLVAYTLYAFVWQAATGFLPTYLRVGKGLPKWVGTISFALLFGVGVLVKPSAGTLSDRIPRDRLAPAVAALGAIALLALIVVPGVWLNLVAVVVFSAGLMAFPPVMQAHLMDTFPASSAGGDLGAMRSVYIGLGSLGTTYVGVVADVATYRLAFLTLVAMLGTTALAVRRASIA
ncbi:MAG: MFS transporter [Halobacteriaceae archaeon]